MMKRIPVFLILLFSLLCQPLAAKTVIINASQIKGDLTTGLRQQLDPLSHQDKAIVFFDKAGTFVIEGTVETRASLEIKGVSSTETVVLFDSGTDRPGFKAFFDDTFISAFGQPDSTIQVSIHDLTFRLKAHQGIWWEHAPKYGIKIYHADKIDVERVNCYSANAKFTNFDLRVCSNITFRHCIVSNFNNCGEGGNIWIRGATHNVSITDNVFYKYGNDELLAFFSNIVNARSDERGNIKRTNIRVSDNDFHYERPAYGQKNLFCDRLFTFMMQEEETPCTSVNEHIEFSNNNVYIDYLCKSVFVVLFNEHETHRDFTIHDNKLYYGPNDSPEKYYRADFEIRDHHATPDTIFIARNEITNDCDIVNPYNGAGHTLLLQYGSNVCLENNVLVNHVTQSGFVDDVMGSNILWAAKEGGVATLRGNVFKGMKLLATVSVAEEIEHYTINATGNYFQDGTRIYCNNVRHLDLRFTHNTFNSNDANFFLQEFAGEGSVVFNHNEVTLNAGGRLMTHWDSRFDTHSLRFTRLEVQDNVFRGATSEQDLMKGITNVGERIVRGNRYE